MFKKITKSFLLSLLIVSSLTTSIIFANELESEATKTIVNNANETDSINNRIVKDETGLVKEYLIDKIEGMNGTVLKDNRFGLVFLNSLNGKTIEEVGKEEAQKLAEQYKMSPTSLVFVVVPTERKMRIVVGDELVNKLSTNQQEYLMSLVKTDFRREEYSKGVKRMLDELPSKLKGAKESKPLNTETMSDSQVDSLINLLMKTVFICLGISMFIWTARLLLTGGLFSSGSDTPVGVLSSRAERTNITKEDTIKKMKERRRKRVKNNLKKSPKTSNKHTNTENTYYRSHSDDSNSHLINGAILGYMVANSNKHSSSYSSDRSSSLHSSSSSDDYSSFSDFGGSSFSGGGGTSGSW